MDKIEAGVCGFCRRSNVEDVCGVLRCEKTTDGPIVAHTRCMQYSALLSQYQFDHFGGFNIDEVFDEYKRGMKMKCAICSKGKKPKGGCRGATAGCAIKSCRRTFHYYCARVSDTVVTKRLVVHVKSKDEKMVLYRVFCTKEHEHLYRQNLKQYLATSSKMKKSSTKLDSFDTEELSYDTNTTFVQVSDFEDSPEKPLKKEKPSTPKKQKDVQSSKLASSTGSEDDPESLSSANEDKVLNKCSHLRKRRVGDKNGSYDKRRLLREDSDREQLTKKRKCGVNGLQKTSAHSAGSPVASQGSTSRRMRGRSAHETVGQSKVTGVPPSVGTAERTFAPMHELRINVVKMADNATASYGPGGDRCVSGKQDGKCAAKATMATTGLEKCALCIVEDSTCTSELKSRLQEVITERFHVKTKNIIVWQDLDESASILKQNMMYFIKDVANLAIDCKRPEVEKMLFDAEFVEKKNMTEYQLQASFLQDLDDQEIIVKTTQLTWATVDNRLKKAESVGTVLRIKGQPSLVLFLDDEGIDRSGDMRRVIGIKEEPEEEVMFTWTPATVVTQLSGAADPEMCSLEYSTIMTWFQDEMPCVSEVVVYPQDGNLVPESTRSSVVEDISAGLQCDENITNPYRVVVLKHLDQDVVNIEAYCRKAVRASIRASSESHSGLVVLLDIQSLLGKNIHQQLKNIFRGEDGEALSVTMKSAFDPSSIVVSCVVVEIHLDVTEVQKSQSPLLRTYPPLKYIKDSQTPSTSKKAIRGKKPRKDNSSTLSNLSADNLGTSSMQVSPRSSQPMSSSSSSSSSSQSMSLIPSTSPSQVPLRSPVLRSSRVHD